MAFRCLPARPRRQAGEDGFTESSRIDRRPLPRRPGHSGPSATKTPVPSLTPRAALQKLGPMQMVDVQVSGTDGPVLILPRCTQGDTDQKLLAPQLKLTMPEQPRPAYPVIIGRSCLTETSDRSADLLARELDFSESYAGRYARVAEVGLADLREAWPPA
jgi:hypothetical protein